MRLHNICFFDLETTGADTTQDRIVQICITKYFDGEKTTKTKIVNPGRKIPKEASDVHGITDEMVKDQPTFKQIAKGIFEFIGDCDLGGYNSDKFDIPLLIEEFLRCSIVFDTSCRSYIDVMKLETALNPRTLAAVFQRYFNEELDGAHDAEVDVKGTVRIFEAQMANPLVAELNSVKEFDEFTQGDKKRVDFSGVIYEMNGEYYFSFGKHKDNRVLDNISYVNWMLNSSFSRETKQKLSAIIK